MILQYFTSLIYISESCANTFGHPVTSFSPSFLPRARWKLIGNPKVYLGLHFTVWCLFFIQILYGQTQSNSESITWKLKKKSRLLSRRRAYCSVHETVLSINSIIFTHHFLHHFTSLRTHRWPTWAFLRFENYRGYSPRCISSCIMQKKTQVICLNSIILTILLRRFLL